MVFALIKIAQNIIGTHQPCKSDIGEVRWLREPKDILKDNINPSHSLCTLLLSGKRCRRICCRTTRWRLLKSSSVLHHKHSFSRVALGLQFAFCCATLSWQINELWRFECHNYWVPYHDLPATGFKNLISFAKFSWGTCWMWIYSMLYKLTVTCVCLFPQSFPLPHRLDEWIRLTPFHTCIPPADLPPKQQ